MLISRRATIAHPCSRRRFRELFAAKRTVVERGNPQSETNVKHIRDLKKVTLGRPYPFLTAPGSMIPRVTVFGEPDPVAVSGRGNLERDNPA
jgi:hypothetical protein